MKFLTLTIATALSICTFACSDKTPTLVVHVVTGLVPGPEFRYVQTSLLSADTARPSLIASSEALARFENDYTHGNRVAGFDAARGAYRVRVRLLRPNSELLVERIVAVNLIDDAIVTVHLTRDCVGVVCPSPGGSPEFSTCLAGRCVDPSCSEERPELCPAVSFCREASDCGATAACAEAACEEGICIPSAIRDACTDGEWCNPDVGAGCQPFIPEPATNGIACGTICAQPDSPCQFGYWNCADPDAPRCDALQLRPSSVVCAEGRVCDTNGQCVESMSIVPGIRVTPTSGLVTSETGSSASFTVVLTTEPSASVFILVSSSDTSEGTVAPSALAFTSANWNVPQVVTVTGVDDSLGDTSQTYTIITAPASSSDADYSGMNADDVSVTNVDDETPGVTISRTSALETREDGSTDTFTVRLNTAPSADVTLTLSSSDASEVSVSPTTLTFTPVSFMIEQSVTLTGVNDDVDDGDQIFAIISSATSSSDPDYDGLAIADLSGSNRDDDTADLIVNPLVGRVTNENGATATFTVRLATEPLSDVALAITSSDTDEGTVSPANVVIASSDWNVARTITLTGVDDALSDGPQMYEAVVRVSSSDDAAYATLPEVHVSATNNDNDLPGVTVTPTSGLITTEAGGTATFDIVLNTMPSANVTISLSSSSVEGTVAPSSVMFTTATWNIPQTVTVTGVNDYVDDGDIMYSIVTGAALSSDTNYNGMSVSDVSVTNTDNDSMPHVTVTPTSGLYTSEAGGTAEFTVVLDTEPSADVSISFYGWDNNEINIASGTLTFTPLNWHVPQTITAVGVDDHVFDADVATSVMANFLSSTDPRYSGFFDIDSVTIVNRSAAMLDAYVKADTVPIGRRFGDAVATTYDATTVAFGAPYANSQTGAVYIYVRTGMTWSQQAVLTPTPAGTNWFGAALSLSTDGNMLAIGAPRNRSAATGINGDQFDISAPEAGAVYIFTRSGTVWSQQAYIKSSNARAYHRFGSTVAITGADNLLFVGAPMEDSGATGINGNQADTSAPESGAVYMFIRSGMTWTQHLYIKSSNSESGDRFGASLATSNGFLAVGAYGEDSASTFMSEDQSSNAAMDSGAVYVYSNDSGSWVQTDYVKASNTNAGDHFGWSVSIAGFAQLAVGAPGEDSRATGVAAGVGGEMDDNSMSDSGAVYVYQCSLTSPCSFDRYLKPSNTWWGAGFGTALQLSSSGYQLLVGSPGESTANVGIQHLPTNVIGANSSGAAYMFRWQGTWAQSGYIKAHNPESLDTFGMSVAMTLDTNYIFVGAPSEGGDGAVYVYPSD